MTRIFVDGPLAEGTSLPLPEAAARHVGQVLRMRAGEPLTLFDGRGGEYAATVLTVERREVVVRIGAFDPVDRESPLRLTLAQCVSKGDRMDYTIQKAVELGVTAIVPLLSARSVVKLDAERWDKKLDHWRGVVASACEQSGRTRLPPVAPVQTLNTWLPQSSGLRLLLAPGAAQRLKSLPPVQQATLLVGPEGGLGDDETAAAVRAGFVALGLGPRVLRTETAGVALLAALQAQCGDLG
jgi:16S rRNA (uracil1498-N3)-methyltransferase